jgi:hypothetical protein
VRCQNRQEYWQLNPVLEREVAGQMDSVPKGESAQTALDWEKVSLQVMAQAVLDSGKVSLQALARAVLN